MSGRAGSRCDAFALGCVRNLLRPPRHVGRAPELVDGTATTHHEEAVSAKLEALTTHEVQHVWPHHMNSSAKPRLQRQGLDEVEVLVVAVEEECGEGLAFEPVKGIYLVLIRRALPEQTKVPQDDQVVVAGQMPPCAAGELLYLAKVGAAVGVPGEKDRHG